MDIFADTAIWVLFSFIVFVFIMFRFGKSGFLSLLDSRIENIRKEIETAESLRIEAQELLALYQRKQRDAAKEAETIIETAKEHTKEIRKQAEIDLKATMKLREQRLKDRIERMEKKAIQEIRAHAAELAVKATQEIIAEQMNQAANTSLVDQSIKNVAGQLK